MVRSAWVSVDISSRGRPDLCRSKAPNSVSSSQAFTIRPESMERKGNHKSPSVEVRRMHGDRWSAVEGEWWWRVGTELRRVGQAKRDRDFAGFEFRISKLKVAWTPI